MSSFSAHIQHALEKNGITQSHRVIVAVSGGADSMALLHTCVSLHYDCVAAHVNYGLRGADSDADEMCVRNYCSSASVPIEVLRVQNEHWHSNPGSTQEAARHIRYNWFDALLKQHEASCIVTAHHAKDQLETMLQQFIRGGGGKSLYGMAIRQGAVVRPMLSISKEEVLEYAEANHIAWRNDASNETDDYIRNLIRHQIIPVIEDLNPSIYKGIQQRSAWMHQEQAASNDAVNSFLAKHLVYEDQAELLSRDELRTIEYSEVVLWRWLQPKGFSSPQVIQIFELLEQSSSEPSLVSSDSHDVFIQHETAACVRITGGSTEIIHELPWSNGRMQVDACSREEVSFTSDDTRQYLDIRQLTFPLTIREWQHGDVFFPLGAPGKQKVADFLTHAKIPSWKKKNTRVLISDTTIISVLGMRICEKFKITTDTKECVRIQFSSIRNLSGV